MSEFETQCWTCPICYDDHKVNEPNLVYCKPRDLRDLRTKYILNDIKLSQVDGHLKWLRDGIQHFTHDEDAEQVKHLITEIDSRRLILDKLLIRGEHVQYQLLESEMKLTVSEKAIEKQIIIWLWSKRIFCTKIDNTGIYDAKLGKFRHQHGSFKRKGISDIVGIYEGRFLAIEVKSESGRLSSDQKVFLDDVKANGGIAIVARSVDDVERALKAIKEDQIAKDGA